MSDPGDFVTDYDFGIAPMEALGWQVETVPWREPAVAWDNFDAVYICTPWDYPDDPEGFLQLLATIDASRAILVNDLALVLWTLKKTYLRDLEDRGADIVPSTWYETFHRDDVAGFFARHDADKVVIKPLVGANAADTFVLADPVSDRFCSTLAATFHDRPFIVQPFIEAIRTEGEFSLFFLGGEYSHAILKTPGKGDFRVQEEHGAEISPVAPPMELVRVAERIVASVQPEPVYARADFVRDGTGRFLLMELELIEPSLYLRTNADAAERFAQAFDAHVRQRIRCRELE